MARGTRRSQSVNLTTESSNGEQVPLQGTTDIDVPLQPATRGRRGYPGRDLEKERTSSIPHPTPATQNTPPATRARKNGNQEELEVGAGKKRTATNTVLATRSAPPAKRARGNGPNVGDQEGLKVGASTEDNREQEHIDGVSAACHAKGKRPQLQRTYSFYPGRGGDDDNPATQRFFGQNIQPDVTDNSDDNFEDEADWHDEPNEDMAPRQRSKVSQALDVETPIWQVSATSPGPSTSGGVDSLSSTELATSRQPLASGRAMSRQPLASRSAVSQQHLASGGRHITGQREQLAIAASGDGPLLQGGAGGALPLQGGAGSALSQQGGAGGALSQQGGAGSALLPQGSVGAVIGMPEPAPTWPAHTDLVFQPGTNKILLTAQEFHVRIVIQDAIDKLHTNLLSIDAYPTLKAARDVIKDALLSSAKSHFPGTLHVHNRIQSDANYIAVITHLVRARIPLFRSDVKERCSTIIATELLAIGTSAKIAQVVESQLSSYNYIFPMAPGAMKPTSRLRPYQNDRIIQAIHKLYFEGGARSFANQFSEIFQSSNHLDGVAVREVPVPMVALVATGIYAALREWRTGVHRSIKFSANGHLDTYRGNIDTINEVRARRGGAFHHMMAYIYTQANSIEDSTTAQVPIAELEWDELEE